MQNGRADSTSKCTTRGLSVSCLKVYTMVVNTMGVRTDAESGRQAADRQPPGGAFAS